MPINDLPDPTQNRVDEELDSYRTAKNKKYAGEGWWPTLQGTGKVSKQDKRSTCLRVVFDGSGTAHWTLEGPGLFACRRCTNIRRPCMMYDKLRNKIVLLPLHFRARSKGSHKLPSEPGYWICDTPNSTQKNKDLRNAWGETQSKRKAPTCDAAEEGDDDEVEAGPAAKAARMEKEESTE